MAEIDVKEMLEAGVHFGHKRDKWNPKMRPFIYTERDGIHIFDLTLTASYLEKAMEFAAKVASEGGTILFVGTKKQVQSVTREAAQNAAMPYMVERWPGGTLTNFMTILGRLKYLKETEQKNEEKAGLTKKENLNISREIAKLNAVFEGIKEVRKLPEALFVADVVKEKNAVREAKKIGIPVIGIVDSNADPSDIDYPIPANDDAVRSVKYISEKLAEIIMQNKKAPVFEEILADSEQPTPKGAKEKDESQAKEADTTDLEKVEAKLEEDAVTKKSRIIDEKPIEKKKDDKIKTEKPRT